MNTKKLAKCESCNGNGWVLAATRKDSGPMLGIQRCDACERFKDDEEAVKQVAAWAVAGKRQQERYVLNDEMPEGIETARIGARFKDGTAEFKDNGTGRGAARVARVASTPDTLSTTGLEEDREEVKRELIEDMEVCIKELDTSLRVQLEMAVEFGHLCGEKGMNKEGAIERFKKVYYGKEKGGV